MKKKKQKKLFKKYNYIDPYSKKDAQKAIVKKALTYGTAIGFAQIGTQMYINKKIMNKPINSAFDKKTVKRAVVLGLITAASNAAYDEVIYARKGVIRK